MWHARPVTDGPTEGVRLYIVMDMELDQQLAEIRARDRTHALEQLHRIAEMYETHVETLDVREATPDDY